MLVVYPMLFMVNNDLVSYGNFSDESEQIMSWMMDEFIHWPKPYLLTVHTLTIQWFSTDRGVPVTVVPGQYNNHINHSISIWL